jgi:hypothetical protein
LLLAGSDRGHLTRSSRSERTHAIKRNEKAYPNASARAAARWALCVVTNKSAYLALELSPKPGKAPRVHDDDANWDAD